MVLQRTWYGKRQGIWLHVLTENMLTTELEKYLESAMGKLDTRLKAVEKVLAKGGAILLKNTTDIMVCLFVVAAAFFETPPPLM